MLPIKVTIKSAAAFTASARLAGTPVPLTLSGDTWTGTLDVAGAQDLRVQAGVSGLSGTAWKVDVALQCPAAPVSLLSKESVVGGSGRSRVDRTVEIPQPPCAN